MQTLDTSLLPPAEQFGAWASGIEGFDLTPLGASDGFAARVTIAPLGRAVLLECELDPVRFARTRSRIRRDRFDHYSLQLVLQGRFRGHVDNRAIDIGPGQPCLTDFLRPSSIDADRQHTIIVVLERDFLEEAMPPVDIHGPLPETSLRQVLAAYLTAICPLLPTLDTAAGAIVATQIRDLVAACAADLPLRDAASDPRTRNLRASAIAYIRRNLAEPLEPASICAALGISRSALYRAFGDEAGVGRFVRRYRLQRAHRVLQDTRQTATIEEIAHQLGFGGKSQFSRLFRAHFGYTATELRRQCRRAVQATGPTGPVQVQYRALIDQLSG